MEFTVAFYSTAEGEVPMAAFLQEFKLKQPSLSRSVSAGLVKLQSSKSHGPPLTQHVDAEFGILELRVGDRDIARVFFFFQPGRRIVCTNGYVKKSQKLDPAELALARRYKTDWEGRNAAAKE